MRKQCQSVNLKKNWHRAVETFSGEMLTKLLAKLTRNIDKVKTTAGQLFNYNTQKCINQRTKRKYSSSNINF